MIDEIRDNVFDQMLLKAIFKKVDEYQRWGIGNSND